MIGSNLRIQLNSVEVARIRSCLGNRTEDDSAGQQLLHMYMQNIRYGSNARIWAKLPMQSYSVPSPEVCTQLLRNDICLFVSHLESFIPKEYADADMCTAQSCRKRSSALSNALGAQRGARVPLTNSEEQKEKVKVCISIGSPCSEYNNECPIVKRWVRFRSRRLMVKSHSC
jgi:hypothetical protein